MAEKLTFFDYLKAIFSKKKLEFNKKICSVYMILNYLSHERDLLPIVNQANKMFGSLSDEAIYTFLFHSVPKGNRFIKYIKKEKQKNDKEIEFLMKHYHLSFDEAKKSIF